MAIHNIIEGVPIFDCGTIERVYASNSFSVRTDAGDMLR
jgi:hypothetical protein